MAEAARDYRQHEEFWKPVSGPKLQTASAPNTKIQANARSAPSVPLPIWLDLTSLCARLGQTTASLIALILGCSCLVAAVLTGFIFTVATLTDWQAIQLWRIEWLLAAIALFVAGILLKRR